MFNKLFQAIKVGLGLSHYSTIINLLAEMMSLVEEEYVKDKDAKNAAIDALIEILQAHKNTPPAV